MIDLLIKLAATTNLSAIWISSATLRFKETRLDTLITAGGAHRRTTQGWLQVGHLGRLSEA